VDELRVVHVAVREEAAQAWEAEAKAREDAARAQEEAAKAHEDLTPLLARMKELEEDVASVSDQRDALNIQIEMVSVRVRTLEDEVATLKGMVQERDEALSGTGREIETLRAVVHDKDEALQASEKAREELRDEVVGWQTHAEGKPFVVFRPWPRGPRLMLTWCLCFRAREAAARGLGDGYLVLEPLRGRGWANLAAPWSDRLVCDGLGVEPDVDTKEDALGNLFVRRMAVLGRLVHEKVRGGLYHGVKRAMLVVRSGFEYDMGLIVDGFITDPDRTDEENEVACLNLIEAAEEPGGRLAKLFKVEVAPPADDEGL
jgi:hypothetical protein